MDSSENKSDASVGGPAWRRALHQLGHLLSHNHEHESRAGTGDLIDSGAVGIRATKVSLVGLGITAALQAVVVVISGSVTIERASVALVVTGVRGRISPPTAYSVGLEYPPPSIFQSHHLHRHSRRCARSWRLVGWPVVKA